MDKSTNIKWHENILQKSERYKNMNQSGLVLWLTGLSGSGKSTIAAQVEKNLAALGFIAYILDGDNMRHGLCKNLGFSDEDRAENIRRIAEVAAVFADSGMITIVSVISPLKSMRCAARETIDKAGGGIFNEVYIKASVEECKARDPKGLYKKAASGEIKNFTGLDAPYEEPEDPELLIDTETFGIEAAASAIIKYILKKELPYLYKKIITDAIDAEIFAAKLILEVYKKDFSVEYKDDKSPLTEADKKSNDLILERLHKYTPYLSFLSEETRDDETRLDNDFCLIIDPLDGTKEFVKKNGEFTINIGLSYNGEAVLGAVLIPCTNELFYAVRGAGAFYVNLDKTFFTLFDDSDRINVSCRTDNLILMQSRSHGDEKTAHIIEANRNRISSVITSGSSIKGCLIAKGEADIYYRFGLTSQWDTCAMQSVVEAAGGIMLQCDGTPLVYNRKNTLNEKGFYILNRAENRLD